MRRIDQDIDENVWRVYEEIDEDPIIEGYTLKELRNWTDQLIAEWGEDAFFCGTDLIRAATPEEVTAELKRQADLAKSKRKVDEAQERAQYEALRAKFEGQPKPPTTQPQGFRADLWARINRHFTLERVSALIEIQSIDSVCIRTRNWQWGWGTADRETPTQQQRADILTRWTVYQGLKPLYDLVDGAQGEAAMPRDVVRAWWDRAPPTDCGNDHCPWSLRREDLGLVAQGPYRIHAGNARNAPLSNALANFATVLDAVAERRVAERIRGQTPAPTVTPVPAQPEPRRFADVRPDRHGWRWWRVCNDSLAGSRFAKRRLALAFFARF